MRTRTPVLYIPHGGGPLPVLGEAGHQKLVPFLRKQGSTLKNVRAILLISAHWEEPMATLTGGESPMLIYDYFGFPPESYEIEYPAAGNPALAAEVQALLHSAGLTVEVDTQRGFDHGMFIPLKWMIPDAHIPCVQLSLLRGLDPTMHIRIGEALQPLRNEQVLILGSGFSFHNLRTFYHPLPNGEDKHNEAFQDFLLDTCTSNSISESQCEQRLKDWSKAPYARYCHPREDHLLPLHVCYGAAKTRATCVFDDLVFGKRALSFLWK